MTTPSSTRMVGVLRTAAISAAMISAPARSPCTRTMRRRECAASRDSRKLAFLVAVERNAVAEQILDARRGLAGDQLGDVAVDDAGAGGDRILDVGVDRIVGAERGGDAALGAGGRSALADRRRGDHGDGARRQLQRAEQSRQAAADDDDIVEPVPGFGGEEILLGGVGHLARHSGARARPASND